MGPHLTQSRLGEAYLHTKWHLDASSRLATIEMGRKLGGSTPFEEGGWVPSKTKSPGLRPSSTPSAILIHPAVRPQQTWAENWEGLCSLFGDEGR